MTESYNSRFLQFRLLDDASETRNRRYKAKVILVLGARQTGKSTLLNHCIGKAKRIFYLNLQDRRLRRRYEADEGLLLRELSAANSIDTVFIDEIQKVPALLDDVQFLYDRDPRRFRFFLTGSSARQLKRRSANLLPGRVHILRLSPVLQAEQRKCDILPLEMKTGKKFPRRSLNDYLIFGNLPGLYQEKRSSWAETLSAYVDLYIENEIRQEHIVEDMGAFAKFLQVAALESGQCVNFTRLAGAVGVAANTLRNFYQVLEDTYVGIRVQPFGRSRKRILQSPRFLIFDLGVRHVLAELPLNTTLLKLDAGHIFEQWVLTELYYRCCYMGKGYRLSTWQTSTGAEVDAIIETPDKAIPVEIKWTENPSPRDAQHVQTFLNLHRSFSHRGYVICRCPRRQQLTEKVTALPWDKF
jgi:predicted AAA+ superfamily ATPase